jgi:hypothetical protein
MHIFSLGLYLIYMGFLHIKPLMVESRMMKGKIYNHAMGYAFLNKHTYLNFMLTNTHSDFLDILHCTLALMMFVIT